MKKQTIEKILTSCLSARREYGYFRTGKISLQLAKIRLRRYF